VAVTTHSLRTGFQRISDISALSEDQNVYRFLSLACPSVPASGSGEDEAEDWEDTEDAEDLPEDLAE